MGLQIGRQKGKPLSLQEHLFLRAKKTWSNVSICMALGISCTVGARQR